MSELSSLPIAVHYGSIFIAWTVVIGAIGIEFYRAVKRQKNW